MALYPSPSGQPLAARTSADNTLEVGIGVGLAMVKTMIENRDQRGVVPELNSLLREIDSEWKSIKNRIL